MGEAKARKKAAQAAVAAIAGVDRKIMSQAVIKTMSAITDLEGADCLGYAIIGAGLLKNLGVPARAVAGHASWRVGPGDGDMVVHDPGAEAVTVHQPFTKPDIKAAMFHAWIEVDGPSGIEVVDLTTFQLADKARALDAIDGGKTQVDFCPDFIWERAPGAQWTSRAVAQAPQGGVFSYRREPRIEGAVFSRVDHEALETAVSTASFVYDKLARNEPVMVIGVDGETGQHQTQAPKMNESVAKQSMSEPAPQDGCGAQEPFTKARSPLRP
jgi:hypothetical protein